MKGGLGSFRPLGDEDVSLTLNFGKSAEGFIRATLTVDTPRLVEAVERIGKLSW